MGNTHPKSLEKPLELIPKIITTCRSESIVRGHITVYGYVCADYDVERHHKPVSTAITPICYQGQLKPNITLLGRL